jgi:hypothetical protein
MSEDSEPNAAGETNGSGETSGSGETNGATGAGTGDTGRSFREFLETVGAAALAGRRTLMERTIEQHAPRARERVAALREQHPELTSDALAERFTREAASQAAVVGGMIAVPGLVPGFGTGLTIALAGPEVPWLFREQIKLMLDVATVYGRDPGDVAARLPEVEGLFGTAFTAVQLGHTGTQLVLSIAARAGRRQLTGLVELSVRIAAAALGLAVRRRAFFRRLPFLGIPIGATANAMALVQAGNEARQRYGQVAVSIYEGTGATVEEEPDTAEETPDAAGTASEPETAGEATNPFDTEGERPGASSDESV